MSWMNLVGTQAALKALKKVGDDYENKLQAAVKSAGLIVQNAAKPKAPFKTGNLRSSIHVGDVYKVPKGYACQVGTDVVYAAVQEFGGGNNIPPHPYMRPALDENLEKCQKEIAEVLKNG